MCRKATESPSHFLRKSHMVARVGRHTAGRCFGEVLPSIPSVGLGRSVSERRGEGSQSESKAESRELTQVFVRLPLNDPAMIPEYTNQRKAASPAGRRYDQDELVTGQTKLQPTFKPGSSFSHTLKI